MKRKIRFNKNIFSQESIDKTISGGILRQLGLLLFVIFALLIIFSSIVIFWSVQFDDSKIEWGDRLWMVYNNFIDTGNQVAVNGWSNRLVTIVISLCGSILLGGVLISTISNIIERRVEAVRTGMVTYKNLSQHFVIIGFCEITVSLIKEICKETPEADILLMSNQEAESVRHSVQSQLDKKDEKRVKIYFGNIESKEELQRLNIQKAQEVYILGEQEAYGRDSKNIECVHYVSQLRGKPKSDLLMPVYVQFDRIPSYSNIQKLSMPKAYYCFDGTTPNIYFRPFNYHENWARQLWSLYTIEAGHQYLPLDYRTIHISPNAEDEYVANSSDHVHLVIVGFNRMGRSLLLEALRICHYANYDDKLPTDKQIRTVITVVDQDMDSMKNYFKAQFPYLDSQITDIKIEYINDDICSPKMRTAIEQWSQDEHRMLTIAICISDPDISLSLGLNLPPVIYEQGIPVLIRQEIQTDLGKLIDTDNGRYKQVKIFGMLNQGMQKSMLQDTLASYVHQFYTCEYCSEKAIQEGIKDRKENETPCPFYQFHDCKFHEKSKGENRYLKLLDHYYKTKNSEFYVLERRSRYSWSCLSEINRWANRYQLDAYLGYCRTLGYKVRKKNDTDTSNTLCARMFNEDLPPQALHFLMRMEKHRWNAERSIEGWRYGVPRNVVFLIHPLIVPFGEIERNKPNEIEKDKDVIANLPYILALGGYELEVVI